MDLKKVEEEVIGELVEGVSELAVPEPMITDHDVEIIKALLMPGDLIFCRRNYELSNVGEKILTNSYWGHVGIYIGWNDEALPVYESVTKEGFRKVSVERICLTKDAIAIGRKAGNLWMPAQIEDMEDLAMSWIGKKPYNFEMDWNNESKLYCSQAAVKLWLHGDKSMRLDQFKQTNILQMEISPQNVFDSVNIIGRFGDKGN